MSICVVISRPDGIVVASDSKTTPEKENLGKKILGFSIGNKNYVVLLLVEPK